MRAAHWACAASLVLEASKVEVETTGPDEDQLRRVEIGPRRWIQCGWMQREARRKATCYPEQTRERGFASAQAGRPLDWMADLGEGLLKAQDYAIVVKTLSQLEKRYCCRRRRRYCLRLTDKKQLLCLSARDAHFLCATLATISSLPENRSTLLIHLSWFLRLPTPASGCQLRLNNAATRPDLP